MRQASEKRTIYFTTYTCSGTSWLLNCFIELGILIASRTNKYFRYVSPYNETHSNYILYPDIDPVGLTPSLTLKNNTLFKVRNDLFVEHLEHTLPPYEKVKNAKTIILIRDPRDTLWSYFNVDPLNDRFSNYLTGSNYGQVWNTFYEQCLALPNTGFFKFEDYKNDAFGLLKNILTFAEIDESDQAIQSAVDNSSYEVSKKAEQVYLASIDEEARNRLSKRIINRSGKANQWKDLPEHQAVFDHIVEFAKPVMKIFNYPI